MNYHQEQIGKILDFFHETQMLTPLYDILRMDPSQANPYNVLRIRKKQRPVPDMVGACAFYAKQLGIRDEDAADVIFRERSSMVAARQRWASKLSDGSPWHLDTTKKLDKIFQIKREMEFSVRDYFKVRRKDKWKVKKLYDQIDAATEEIMHQQKIIDKLKATIRTYKT